MNLPNDFWKIPRCCPQCVFCSHLVGLLLIYHSASPSPLSLNDKHRKCWKNPLGKNLYTFNLEKIAWILNLTRKNPFSTMRLYTFWRTWSFINRHGRTLKLYLKLVTRNVARVQKSFYLYPTYWKYESDLKCTMDEGRFSFHDSNDERTASFY